MSDTNSVQPYTPKHSTIHLDEMAYRYLSESAKWARFISVAGFVFCGILIVAGVFLGNAIGIVLDSEKAGTGIFFSIFSIILALVLFFPCLYLFKFSSGIKRTLKATVNLQIGLRNLKSCLRFISILIIILLSVYGLGIIIISVTSIFTK